MGKGSNPRNNHSKKWYANYDDIDWSANPKILTLTDEQLDAFERAKAELENLTGAKLTRFDENRIIEAVKWEDKE